MFRHVATNQALHIVNELREFQPKHDYQYKYEPRGTERSSRERTSDFLVRTKPELSSREELGHLTEHGDTQPQRTPFDVQTVNGSFFQLADPGSIRSSNNQYVPVSF